MWYLENIPRVLHLYWGRNKPLSYMRFLTAKSFSILNPNWHIFVYYPKESTQTQPWETDEQKSTIYTGFDYFPYLQQFCTTKEIDFKKYAYSEVHRSDLLRWKLLYDSGGFWSDFDILFIKSMDNLYVNKEEFRYIKDLLIKDSIGFLASSGKNKIFKDIFQYAFSKKDIKEYQDVGREIFINYLSLFSKENTIHLYPEVVYPIQWDQIKLLYSPLINCVHKNTIGIHWFAGAPDSTYIESKITPDELKIKPWCDMKIFKEMKLLGVKDLC